MQMGQLCGILLHLESEQAQTPLAVWQHQVQVSEAQPIIKVKPGPNISTYRHLLEEGKYFNLADTLNNSSFVQPIQKRPVSGLWMAKWYLRSASKF